MKVPYSWLKDYVDVNLPPQELADKLTGVGVPVETIEYISPEVTGVIAGKILKRVPHPNADRLSLCDVDTGEAEPLRIVTGAQNVREGHTVPVAVHGANLTEGLKIKRSKIRGEASVGMMCSAKELGLNIKDLPIEQREGVMILPEGTPVGKSLIELFCLNDPIFVFEPFANRPDLLSIIGIAREVAALVGKELKEPAMDFPEISQKASDEISVKIADYNLCSRYSGRIISDLTINEAPLWMQGRLMAAGIRSVSNVVDITNYVMLETGQPLHAFDFDQVGDRKIIVRPAGEGEEITTLDGEKRKLDSSVIVIADAEKPIGLAGVMGGLHSEISKNTRRIFLESANFNPVFIRRTAIKLNLRSESSRRFEKGIDFFRVDYASRRACYLLSEMGASIYGGETADSIAAPESVNIRLRPARVNKILGTEISKSDIEKLLSGIEFKLKEDGCDFLATVPPLRKDVTMEIDIIEEIARLNGYDRIPTTYPGGKSEGRHNPDEKFDDLMRNLAVSCGLCECITPSLQEEEIFDKYGINGADALRVLNPLTQDQAVMRTDGLPSLIEVVKRNAAARIYDCRIFEISRFYRKEEKKIGERREITIIVSAPETSPDANFFDLKGIVEYILDDLGIEPQFSRSEISYLHPGKTAKISACQTEIGYTGMLHPQMAKNLDLEYPPAMARIFLEPVQNLQKIKTYSPIPRFPGMERDIAVVLDRDTPSEDVKKVAMEMGAPILQDARCFDVYTGPQVPENKKSLAFSLSFSAADRTLTDKEVEEKIEEILKSLGERMSVTLRGA